ncbi:MAG: sigma 54-interacting transcriptional regulator [Spirochaetales bacterium]|nr:sigma 54-interacting transcriptional regulator [Leptospiraceae bacterium]MCP5481729.1 sigma 54-interacting transcriptional regulator [Spirochaetales bacterium]
MNWLDEMLEAQLSPDADPRRPLQALVRARGAYTLFFRSGRAFRVLERAGYPEAYPVYDFLSSRPDAIRPAFEGGAARVFERAGLAGMELWAAVDRLEQPRYLLLAEVPPTPGVDPGPLLRQSLILQVCAERQRGPDHGAEGLPVWLRDRVAELAQRPSPVLVVAEAGSGKEELVLAFLREQRGDEAAGIFFHPGRLSEAVQLRELFGDPAGARLGGPGPGVPIARRPEPVVVIQEAADLAAHAQLRLLAHFSAEASERMWIFESSRDLQRMAAAERFLPGLYRMLEDNTMILPPVRAQKAELPAEVARLMEEFRQRFHREVEISPAALAAIQAYDWPGNWRELRNTLESAFLMCSEALLDAADLRLGLWTSPEDWDDLNLRKRSQEVEKSLLLRAYALHGGNQVQMARALGISRGSLQYKLEKYKLN